MRSALAALLGIVLCAHVGSPDVFFQGNAGPYAIRVVVRPPEVVPGIARVVVRAGGDVERVTIRPVFWRAGEKGAPVADETRRLQGEAGQGTFEGSLWLMSRGAYSVQVTAVGKDGEGQVIVPVAAVATGQLALGPWLGVILATLGILLVAGLVNIVYKGAGESLVPVTLHLDREREMRARKVAAISIPIIALGLFGGARWWDAVDRDYDNALYRPAPLALRLDGNLLHVGVTDTVWQSPQRVSALMADHGKMMHLFLVRAGDAGAFAHLHPRSDDTSAVPAFTTRVPPLPAGRYHVYGDVVHETGFERTLVGQIDLAADAPRSFTPTDPDDAWLVGDATESRSVTLADGSTMQLEIASAGDVIAGREVTFRISVVDRTGRPAALDTYLGMRAHGVVTRPDGQVYVHLHPMGTITVASQEAFVARNRGDTNATGRLRFRHSGHTAPVATADSLVSSAEFPYAFPRPGDYRLFFQVKRGGRIHTGAFTVKVGQPAGEDGAEQ